MLHNLKFPGQDERLRYVVAAILGMPRETRTLPVGSSIMIGEYPVRTRLVNYITTTFRLGVVFRPNSATLNKSTNSQINKIISKL